jgi:hypothetical protein
MPPKPKPYDTRPLGAPPPGAVRTDPCRQPCWRYDTAAAAALNRRVLLRRREDRHTCQLNDHLSRELRCRTAAERDRVAEQAPAIAAALAIYRDVTRAVAAPLEAHLLTRRSLKAVAERTTLSLEIVTSYQTYFFSLGEHLQCAQYVRDQVIAPELITGLAPATAGRYATLKFIGYACGPAALDRLLSGKATQVGELWQQAAEAFERLQEFADLQSIVAAALGASGLSVRRSASEIIEALRTSDLNKTATHVLGVKYG